MATADFKMKKTAVGSAGSTRGERSTEKVDGSKSNFDDTIRYDIVLLCSFAVCLLIFISNFGIGGKVTAAVSSFFFGLFGMPAYAFPIIAFLGVSFFIANRRNILIKRKSAGMVSAFVFFCAFVQLLAYGYDRLASPITCYRISSTEKIGGGIIGGSIAQLFGIAFGLVGAYVLVILAILISVVIATQKPFMKKLGLGGIDFLSFAKDKFLDIKEKKGFALADKKLEKDIDDEIFFDKDFDFAGEEQDIEDEKKSAFLQDVAAVARAVSDGTVENKKEDDVIEEILSDKVDIQKSNNGIKEIKAPDISEYKFPPVSLLKKGGRTMKKNGNDTKQIAEKLQSTLRSFGVDVTVANVSQGPTVTRYELVPSEGVKVSRIVSLSDDIKLNLAVPDIRIEAPIPGKAAVGIEVPNKEVYSVMLRDLIESEEFCAYPSNLAFAVGKDIAGQPVIADIAKMPHILIAGATGAGKSVCINTIVMGILYKAKPSEVKLVMIDPKVVELSVYNGIPHLYIPVVTDPKKAAGALSWAVGEMEKRYKLFADYGVRDLGGYNALADSHSSEGDGKPKERLPQIVIIVDELADLMMVSPNEVEASICRLAQLARAAGIHLILATQRPSVNVITGLIKANMPSRIAFAVSSGVDSRTILDMNGAEKLLGKGDMLFYPQNYPKPVRLQGAFVSDNEVAAVVRQIRIDHTDNEYDENVRQQIEVASEGGEPASADEELDAYFDAALAHIIGKDKISIGMFQRKLKVGFNRAARIMEQLCSAGYVGPDEGNKPRKVLITKEQYENLKNEPPE